MHAAYIHRESDRSAFMKYAVVTKQESAYMHADVDTDIDTQRHRDIDSYMHTCIHAYIPIHIDRL